MAEESLTTSITFARLEDGGLELVIASLERGEMLRMRLAPAAALEVLQSFTAAMAHHV